MHQVTSLLIAILAVLLLPSISHGGMILEDSIPPNFVPMGLIRGSCNIEYSQKTIGVIFGLQQRRLDELETIFWDVSTPSSPSYGAHLSFDELHDLIEPHQDDVQKVENWLITHGVSADQISRHDARDHLCANMTIGIAEKLFNTKYQLYSETGSENYWLKTPKYEIPSELGVRAVFSRARMTIEPRCKRQLRVSSSESSKKSRSEPQEEPRLHNTRATNVDPMIAAIKNSNAPYSYISIGNYYEVILRCPDGSYPTNSLVCQNGDFLKTLVVSTYNYITNKLIQVDSISTTNTAIFVCDQGNRCVQTLAGWGVTTTTYKAILNFSPRTPQKFVPFYHVYQAITSNGIKSDNFTMNFAPIVPSNNIGVSEIKQAYGIPLDYSGTNPNNTQGVIQFFNSYYSPADLQQFFLVEGLPDYSSKVISSGPVENCPCAAPSGEAQLDTELIMAMGLNITTYFYIDDQRDQVDWLVRAMNSPAGFGYVQSISWGLGGEDAARTAYYNTEFMKAGARGISLFVASGDSGQWTNGVGDVNNPNLPSVSEPCPSPYITVVGGTMPVYNGSALVEWFCTYALGSFYTAGSGIVQSEPRPSYQDAAFKNYISKYVQGPIPSFYNLTKRAYPDVSAFALNVEAVIGGSIQGVSGTSAASPIFAGIVALLNDIRLNNGQPTLGFLNPLLYALPSDAFNDITVGDNACIPGYCAPFGFPSAPGYDIPTGLGSINFPVMANYIRLLKNSSASATASVASSSLASTSTSATIASSSSSSSASTSATLASSSSSSSASTSATLSTKVQSSSASIGLVSSTSSVSASTSSVSASTSKAVTTGQASTLAATSTASVSTKATSIGATTSSSIASKASVASTSSTRITSTRSVSTTIAATTASKLSSTKLSASSSGSVKATSTGSLAAATTTGAK